MRRRHCRNGLVPSTPNVTQGDGLVDRKLNDHSGIGRAVLVSGEGNAAAAAYATGSAWSPFRHGGNLLDHGASARIGCYRKPILHWILSGMLGKFVDAALESEYV